LRRIAALDAIETAMRGEDGRAARQSVRQSQWLRLVIAMKA